MKTIFEVKCVNIEAEAELHKAQDSVKVIDDFCGPDGQQVIIGAVSDGCSGAENSELGSQWQVETFCNLAKTLYSSHQGEELGRELARQFLIKLQCRIYELGLEQARNQLVATLLGMVANQEQIVLVLAGDGTFAVNQEVCSIRQTGNRVLYPLHVWLHQDIEKKTFRAIREHVFGIKVLPTSQVKSLIFASDGMSPTDLRRLTSISCVPEILVRQIKSEAEEMADKSSNTRNFRSDDTAVIALLNPDAGNEQFNFAEFQRFCSERSQHNSKEFFTKRFVELSEAENNRVSTRQAKGILPLPGVVSAMASQTREVAVDGQNFLIGAVSDGSVCGKKSFVGGVSESLVETFLVKAQAGLENGLLGKELMQQAVLACVKENASELRATLYAYISCEQSTILFLAGSGSLFDNGQSREIVQKNGVYPADLWQFPENEWGQRFNELFVTTEIPTSKIQSLTIGTAGLFEPLAEYLCRPEAEPEGAAAYLENYYKQKGHKRTDGAFVSLVRSVTDFLPEIGFSAEAQKLMSISLKLIKQAQAPKPEVSKAVPEGLEVVTESGQSISLKWDSQANLPAVLQGRSNTDALFLLPKELSGNVGKRLRAKLSDDLAGQQERRGCPEETARAMERINRLKGFDIWEELKRLTFDPYAIYPVKNPAKQPLISAIGLTGSKGYVPLSWFADYAWYQENGYELKHVCQILIQLHTLLQQLHSYGVYAGNLRPTDVLVNVANKDKYELEVRLTNPETWAVNPQDVTSGTEYFRLDEEFIHPDSYAGMLTNLNPETAAKSDWYCYAVLAAWLFCKVDPFKGKLITEPQAGRIRRMQLGKPIWDYNVTHDAMTPDGNWSQAGFARKEMGRLDRSISDLIRFSLQHFQVSLDPISHILAKMCSELVRCPYCQLEQPKSQHYCAECQRLL